MACYLLVGATGGNCNVVSSQYHGELCCIWRTQVGYCEWVNMPGNTFGKCPTFSIWRVILVCKSNHEPEQAMVECLILCCTLLLPVQNMGQSNNSLKGVRIKQHDQLELDLDAPTTCKYTTTCTTTTDHYLLIIISISWSCMLFTNAMSMYHQQTAHTSASHNDSATIYIATERVNGV